MKRTLSTVSNQFLAENDESLGELAERMGKQALGSSPGTTFLSGTNPQTT